MNKILKPITLIPALIIIIVLLSFIGDITVQNILILTLLYIGLSSAWNLLSGYTGSLSLGHAAFFGIGAYTSTILFTTFELTPWVGIFIGAFVSMVLALIIGLPSFRLHGPFFTLSSIAIAEILRIISINWKSVTSGSMGIRIPFTGGPSNMVFSNPQHYIWLMLGYAVIVVTLIYFIDRSKMGLYLKAIREDEEAATSLGISSTSYKMFALLISAFFTGIGGSLFVQFTLLVQPGSVFDINLSILIALVSIFGGVGTVFGPVVGALIIIPLSESLQSTLGATYPGLHLVIYGVILIVIIRWMPQGLYPSIAEFLNKPKRDEKSKPVDEKEALT